MTGAPTYPGPAALGRGVVVRPGEPAPGFDKAPRIVVDDAALSSPAATVARLHDAWVARTPVVI